MQRWIKSILLGILGLASTADAQVLPWREIEAPAWDRGGEDDLFGYALARDGANLMVGIPGAPTTSAAGNGMVEIYSPSPMGWTLSQRLLPTSNENDEKFGVALASVDDDLAVGSWDAGVGSGLVSGSVHLFKRVAGLWQPSLRIQPAEIDSSDAFGTAVAITADWLAVTAPGYDDAGGIRGAVFLYRRDGAGWSLHQRIEGEDATRAGAFGCALSMRPDRLYIADCLGDMPDRLDTGIVHWYELNASGATRGGSITVPDAGADDQFGYALAASDSHLMIAAARGDPTSTIPHRVYLFARDGSHYVQQLRQELPSFAVSLDLSNDRALLAGPICASQTTPGRVISCVRRFDRSGAVWSEQPSLLQQPEVGYQGFGWSMVADADHVQVGNPFRNVAAGPASGAISQFAFAAPTDPPSRLELPPGYWRFSFNARVEGGLLVAADSRLGTADDFNEGAAWIFDITGNAAQCLMRLDNPEPYAYERFAQDVGVSGNHIVLLASKRVPGGTTLVLRSYQRNGSTIDFTDEFDVFGVVTLRNFVFQTQIQLSGDRLALSGFERSPRGQSPRIAVFQRIGNGWQLETVLEPDVQDEEIVLNFTRMVMSGPRLALIRGEIRAAPAEPRAWVIHVYTHASGSWQLEQTLRPQPNDPPATVLMALALFGDELAITTGDTLQNVLHSRVHTFAFDGVSWEQTARIEEPPGSSEFGRQLAIENGRMVIESFPVAPIADNFVVPLRLYQRHGDNWAEVASFLPSLAPPGQGRLFEFGNPQLVDGRLFASGRREGPGVTTHTHGVLFQFDALDPIFADGFE